MNDASQDLTNPDEQLRSTGLPPEVLALLAFQPDPDANELVLKDLRGNGKSVAIERQNFPWVLAACRQVGSLMLAGAFPPWAPGAVADLIFQLIDFRHQSIELSAEEGMVVLELKKSHGLTLAELAEELESLTSRRRGQSSPHWKTRSGGMRSP